MPSTLRRRTHLNERLREFASLAMAWLFYMTHPGQDTGPTQHQGR